MKTSTEKCDDGPSGKTDLGACNPECTGFYEKKLIKLTRSKFDTNLGGPQGADQICQQELGAQWKALIVGGARRATATALKGDGAQDWVVAKYTHYYNDAGQLIWRTDDVPLLGVRDNKRMNVYAPAFDDSSGNYPWSGWNDDWTTIVDDPANSRGTCSSWTATAPIEAPITGWANFAKSDLTLGASEPCGRKAPLLCIEQ